MSTRPSLLNRAELCGLAPILAEQHPEEVPEGWHGTDHHVEIARCLLTGDDPITAEARAALDWLHSTFDLTKCEVLVERHIVLIDPDTMDVITEGTPDLVLVFSDGRVVVIDWKTGDPANVREPNDNLQVLSYGLGAGPSTSLRCCLVFLDGLKATAQWGTEWTPDQYPGLLARVKAAATRDPAPAVGDWCPDCYQRHYCPAYQARLATALAPVSLGATMATLDDDSASRLAAMVAMVDGEKGWLAAARLALREHVLAGGRVVRNGKRMAIVKAKGRETVDKDALRADGLDKYIIRGADYETTTWRKDVP